MLMGGRHSNYEADFGAAGSERHRHRDGDDAGIRHTWLGDDAAMEHTALLVTPFTGRYPLSV